MPNTIATPSLTLEITEDLNQDGVISAAERSGLVGLRVTLPGSAQVGDLLVVTDGAGHQVSKQLDATDLANGQLAGDVFALPPDGQTFSATVQLLAPDGSVRDSASSSALVGPGDPPPTLAAPVLQIIEDNNGDGVISAAELNGLIGVRALLPAGVQVGDTLYATDWTGNTVSKVLDANDIANGSLQGDVFTAPPDGQLFTISVTIVTAAGISSPAGTAQALMQSAAPPLPAPLVQIIEDSNGDGVLSASELDGLIGARVTLPAGVQVGDTLHAVDQSGYHVSKLIDAADIAAGFLQGDVFQAPADGQTFSLSVTIVTAAGVSSAAGTASVLLQLAPPAGPVVSLDGALDAVGPIEGDVAPGGVTDTGLLIFRGTGTSGHTVTLFDGAVPLGSTVVGSDGQWAFTPDPALADGAHQITAVATDANGLSGAPSAALGFTVDIVAPEQPWVELLNDSDNDGLLSAAEQAAAARVDVRVTLPSDAQAGDTLLLVSQDGQRVDHVLSATELQQGSLVLNGVFALPPAGTPVIVQVGLQDRAGNLSLLSEDFAVVQRAPLAAPLVQILEDADNDGVISAGEAQGALDYRVTLPAGAEVGDLLKIDYTVGGVSGSVFVAIDPDTLAAGTLVLGGGPDDPPAAAPGQTVAISASVITPFGDTSAVGSDSAWAAVAGYDGHNVLGTYSFNDPADLGRDDTGNQAPITFFGGATQVAGTDGTPALDLAGGAAAPYGDITGLGSQGGAMTIAASVRFDSTGNWQRVVDFGQAYSQGIGNIYVGRLDGSNDLTFTIEKSGQYTYRANAVGAITNGSWLNFVATVDDTGLMKLYVNGALAATTQGVPLEVGVRDNLYLGKSHWAPDAAFDGAIDNLVLLKGSVDGLQAAELSGVTPTLPVAALDSATDDVGPLQGALAAGALTDDAQPSFHGTGTAGATVLLTDGGVALGSALVDANGLWQYTPAQLLADGAHAVVAQAVTADGVAGLPTPALDFTVDTVAPGQPGLVLLNDADGDGVVSLAEQNASGAVDLRITLPADAAVGDTLTLVDQAGAQVTHVLTAAELAAGQVVLTDAFAMPGAGSSLSVQASLSDEAGNSSSVSQVAALVDSANHAPYFAYNSYGLPLAVAASGNPNAGYTALANSYGQQTVDGVVVTATGQTGSAAGSTIGFSGYALGDNNRSETLTLSFSQPVHDVRLTWNQQTNWLLGNETLSLKINGAAVTLSAANLSATQAASGMAAVSADGKTFIAANTLLLPGNAGAKYTLHSDAPINTLAITDNVTSGLPGGVLMRVEVIANPLVASAGVAVGSLAPPVLDIDPNDSIKGFAISQAPADTGGHHWQASRDGGLSWVNLDSASTGAAVYLAPTDLVRWTGATSTMTALTLTAVDNTEALAPAAGQTLDLAVTGGSTPYSLPAVLSGVSATPLVLDLDGNGVQTTDLAHGVAFDIAASGQAVATGWVDTHDGLLVLDRNGNGTIDSGAELFGSATLLASGVAAKDGFAALAEMDSNGDGAVTAADQGFDQLQVWVDANHDGMSQAGELRSLAELGITALALDAQAGPGLQNGNLLALQASFRTADGADHALVDVWFAVDGSRPVAAAADGAVAADAASGLPGLAELVGSSAHDSVDVLLSGAGLPAPDAPICLAPEADLPSAHILPASLSGGDQLLALQAHA